MLKAKILDAMGWILDKTFGCFMHPECYIHDPPIEQSEFAEEEPEVIDGACYMTLEQSWELKNKMKNDIEIAKEAVKKAEMLRDGRIGIGGYGHLFTSNTPSDFMHIRDKVDIDRVKRYCKSNGIDIERLIKHWDDINKHEEESMEHWTKRKDEAEFDDAVSNMEKTGNFINWLKDEEEE